VNPRRKIKIFLSDVSLLASSILQAESQALHLVVRETKELGWSNVSFYSNCMVLVEVANTDDMLSKESHWIIRPSLAEVNRALKEPRAANKTAHALTTRFSGSRHKVLF
jgi:hypothetical protein